MKPEQRTQSSQSVKLEKVLPHSREQVWKALIDPEALAQWLLPGTFKPQLGYRFRFVRRTAAGKRQKVHCQVVELEAPCRLAYTWRAEGEEIPTLVSWTLEQVEEGTRLHLEHTGRITSCADPSGIDISAESLFRFLTADEIRNARKQMGRITLACPAPTLRCIGRSVRRRMPAGPLRSEEVARCIR